MAVFNYEIVLENFPDWAIPMTRVVPVLSQPDDKDITNANLFYDFQYWWEKIGSDRYKLQFYVQIIVIDDDLQPEFAFLDLDLYITNEQLISNTNKNKV